MKRWLKRNEIYFTTIAALLFSITAAYVSYVANRISKRQAEMDYFDKLPDFQLTRNQVMNKATGKFENAELVVTKLTGKAKNIGVSTVTLMDIGYSNTVGDNKKNTFRIDGFLIQVFLVGKQTGKLSPWLAIKTN